MQGMNGRAQGERKEDERQIAAEFLNRSLRSPAGRSDRPVAAAPRSKISMADISTFVARLTLSALISATLIGGPASSGRAAETMNEQEYGIDASFFHQRVGFEASHYERVIKDNKWTVIDKVIDPEFSEWSLKKGEGGSAKVQVKKDQQTSAMNILIVRGEKLEEPGK
jgi:hypothetical protein